MDGIAFIALLILVGIGSIALLKYGDWPHTVVEFGDGRAKIVKGNLPRRLQRDLDKIARTTTGIEGRVEFRGEGEKVTVKMKGLRESAHQRVRNTVHMHRNRIKRP